MKGRGGNDLRLGGNGNDGLDGGEGADLIKLETGFWPTLDDLGASDFLFT